MGTRRVESWSIGGFDIVAATDQGSGPHNQDAYVVAHEPTSLRLGVFDGVGGHAHGREAAQAGAGAVLDSAWRQLIEDRVGATAGATTGTIAEVDGDRLRLAWSGDSAAFLLSDQARRLDRPHRSASGQLTNALGLGLSMSVQDVALDGPLLLCTDGVHDWMTTFDAPDASLEAWANGVLDKVRRLGGQDDATLVVVRRLDRRGATRSG